MNASIETRANLLRQISTVADLGKVDPINMHPPCSASDDLADDIDSFGLAVFFAALTLAGAESYLLKLVARLHRHDGQIHILVRAPLSEEMAYFLARGVSVVTNNRKRGSDVFFHRETSVEWRRIWRQKKFEAVADPLGPDVFI